MSPLNPGTVVDPYKVGALIGKGGMGEVYKARDVRLDRTVAIKMLPAALADDTDARVRFEREARAVATLNHPHICTLYDVGPDYLVMEMVDGQPLAGPLPLARALEFATQILSALDAAHRAGITHRDLKPANILVTKQGIKLLDFGLAKLAKRGPAISTDQSLTHATPESATMAQPLTTVQTILGTVYYMSPEQAQGKPADTRSDIFSFGLVLYEMLTGKRAFDGTNPASVIAAIVEREAPSAADVIPPALERLLQRCLAKDPDERWQSARDISHALTMTGDTAAGGSARTSRRTLAFASLAGFLTALVIGVLVWAAWPRPQAERRPLSFHLTPSAGTEFEFSVNSGGSAISPDGQKVAFVAVTNGTPRLWVRTLDSITSREIAGTDGAKLPFWSPDSQQVAFTAVNRRQVLQTAKVRGGSEAQTLSTFDVQVYPSDWSLDGKSLAYTANNQGTSDDIWLLPMMGARNPEPLLSSSFVEHHGQFSPDGRWFAFTSNETGRDDVYVQSFPGAATRRIISSAGGAYPRWGPGAQELFYRASDGNLITVRLVGSSAEPGTPSVVMRLVEAPGLHPYPYDVAADGRILALTPASGAVQDLTLTVLMNWQAALKP